MHKKLLTAIVIGSLFSSIFITSANLLIDPYGIFRILDAPGINQQKEGVRNNIRLVKFLELPLRKPKTLLLGSSRTNDAFNPADSNLNDPKFKPVYNLGIDMARIKEEKLLLEYAISNSKVKTVVFGLDFFMFNSQETTNSTFDVSILKKKANFVDYFKISLLSTEALGDSIKTIRTSVNYPERREFLSNGYRPGNMVFFGLKDYSSLHYFTNYTFLTPNRGSTKYYSQFSLDSEVFQNYRRILKICREKNIDLKLYISPAHSNLDGEVVRASGNWNLMKDWKKKITDITFEEGFELWDFSGYNSITTESVKTPMLNYWDSSHFTEEVAHMVLSKIFGRNEFVPADFGVLITPRNIEAHLEQIDKDRENYIMRNKKNLGLTLKEFEAIKNGTQLDLKRVDLIFKN